MREFLQKNRHGSNKHQNFQQSEQTQLKPSEQRAETKPEEEISSESSSETVSQRKWDNFGGDDENSNRRRGPVPAMEVEDEEEPVQRLGPVPVMNTEEKEPVHRRGPVPLQFHSAEEEEEPVQRKGPVPPMNFDTDEHSQRGHASSDKMPLPVQRKMESSFGEDFSDVNIHTDSSQSKELNAHAFTKGSDIHFAPGMYNPESQKGQELLGHELTHVVQQREGRVQPTVQKKGVNINDDEGLEKEADEMGEKAAKGERTGGVHAASVSGIQLKEDDQDDTERKSYLTKTFIIKDNEARVRGEDFKEKVYVTGDTIPEGKKVGDKMIIPKDSEVTITDIKNEGGKIYGYVKDYGWTAASNFKGELLNETLGIAKATWESQDPMNKTIGDPEASIREFKGFTYIERDPKAKIPQNTWVKVIEESEDDKFVNCSSETDEVLGWTSKSNLNASKTDNAHPDAKQVSDPDARLRDKDVNYESTGKNIPQGSYVIVKEQSENTEPKGKYIKVASVKKENGKNVEDKELGWTAASNLTEGWADFKSSNAEWEDGRYIGQTDLIEVVGTANQIEKVGAAGVDKYLEMASAASAAGVTIGLNSGFRNYAEQKYLYDHQNDPGFNPANRPGTSNHQKGRAFDLNNRVDTGVNDWLCVHAWEYGFIKVYEAAKEAHHWEYRPEKIKQPEIIEKNNVKYKRTFWGTWASAYTDTKIDE